MENLTAIPESSTWLDLLPEDVCGRLAEHVDGGKQGVDALHLALTSQKQTRAVWHSLARHIHIKFQYMDPERVGLIMTEEERAGWIHAFGGYPVTVSVPHCTPEAVDFLRKGKIISAYISADDADVVAALCESSSVRKLNLRISRNTDLSKVFKDIASLPIDELEVRENDDARFEDLLPYATASAKCAKAFDHLKRFRWESCNVLTDGSRSFWEAVAVLPTFTELRFTAAPPERLFSTLSQFQSIQVFDKVPSMAARLGSAVVEYENCSFRMPDLLRSEEVMKLASCPRLESLIIHIHERVQDVLVELICRLPCLKTLDLDWRKSPGNLRGGSDLDLRPGLMLSVVTAASKLQNLSIINGRVPLSEWEPIFTRTGNNLKKLVLIYDLEETEACALLLNMLSIVPRSCKELQVLLLLGDIETGLYRDQEQIARVLKAARKAQIANPTLNGGDLEHHIGSLLFR